MADGLDVLLGRRFGRMDSRPLASRSACLAAVLGITGRCPNYTPLRGGSTLRRFGIRRLTRFAPAAGVDALEAVESTPCCIVLDNVYEHLANQEDALRRMHRALRPGGVLYMLMPNRLWPREVHYGLPFLSWLPLRVANLYLRWSGRGTDYADASYARTYWTLRRSLRHHDWSWRFALPADPSATHAGTPLHYRLGMSAIRRHPALWAVSKSFLVVAKRPS